MFLLLLPLIPLPLSVMAFWMCIAPATFQQPMNMVLGDIANSIVYLDDVVYSSYSSEHITTLTTV